MRNNDKGDFMNILLVNPKNISVFETFGLVFPPLGLLYIAAATEQKGYKVALQDFFISRDKSPGYDFSVHNVVGITSDTRRFPGALDAAKRAKEQGCTVVMGGPHPAFVDEDVLKEKYADFIVKGEGEVTFPELLNTIKDGGDLSRVKGISYLENGNVVRTAPRELIEDLDTLPLPARHLIDMDAYKKYGLKYGGKRSVAVISTSRGCPHGCKFCVTPQMYGRRWRARSAQSVVSEIENVYHEYGYNAIAFNDDNFTVSPRRVKEICNLIMEKELKIWWWSLSTAETIIKNEDMVRLMARAGAKTVYIGVESSNPSTIREFDKKIGVDTPAQAVALLKKNGLQTFASFILGGLSDSTGDILRTIKTARSLDVEVAQFSILTPYPGTDLFRKLKGRLRHTKWHLYDGIHLVFRHGKVSYVPMHLLLIWAYISYYSRGWRPIKGFIKAFIRNTPILRMLHGKTG